ncbi:MAG: TonB-dependent receptor plug domain-containing protein, partial [Saprospiraceae bacterium]
MKQVLFSLLILIGSVGMAFGQRTVSGKVIDSAGEAVIGANVTVKESPGVGTITDIDGMYSLSVPSIGSTLVFSYTGFESQEIALGSSSIIDITMAEGTLLDEVVVTGYGTQIKRELTGNIAKLKTKDVEGMPLVSVDQAIQGKAAGVFINGGAGKLGQAVTVRVRGNSSISANSQPLYVIDGVPITTGDFGNYGGETNTLADINYNDVESIEVLKDASAGAIYGARAANGVILITTKRGKAGKTNISFNYQTGNSEASKRLPFLNSSQFESFYRYATGYADRADGIDPKDPDSNTSYMFGPGGFLDYFSLGTYGTPRQVDNDWQEGVFRKAPQQQADIQISGGNDKTKYFISGQFLDVT